MYLKVSHQLRAPWGQQRGRREEGTIIIVIVENNVTECSLLLNYLLL